MKIKLNIFKDPFNIFAILNLCVTISLFITLMCLIMPSTIEDFDYLFNINVDVETDITGLDLLVNSKSIFYFLYFLFMCLYSIWGMFVLLTKNNERSVFKIMFRTIFYIGGLLFIHNIFTVIFFLFMPIKDLDSILCLVFLVLSFEIVVFGRLVSNFAFVNIKLKTRKKVAFGTVLAFILLAIIAIIVDGDEIDNISIVFFSLIIVSSVLAIPSTILFNDPIAFYFEKETDLAKMKKVDDLLDLPSNLSILEESQFKKNTKLGKATFDDSLTVIPSKAFSNCLNLREVTLPHDLHVISDHAFFNCISLQRIEYKGTIEEFKNIEIHPHALYKAGTNIVHCSDGVMVIDNRKYH